ncbi:MAG: 16S rRNA (adenine(1518)-N(6)/adenine(1519)-N(6))-dimethyltransferase RsmA [Ketobacteraceae bacterium]|nr:16S rRNA (adenine(1518)-N(6)/adenine(1519)-N(6))-dimethyltransferase RsmA [Ketobacteraceae bacterium]
MTHSGKTAGIVEGHRARKRFGQNFLSDQGIIDNIVSAIAPGSEDLLVEIGPGLGALTAGLIERVDQLHVVELDKDLIPFLIAKFEHTGKLRIHQADALQFDFSQLREGGAADSKLRVVGNLPYNISTPLIFHLIDQAHHIQDMHFMLQKEVVERLAAGVGDKAYGRLGIMVQYFCQVEPLFEVPPESFNPPPKVNSAIVKLTPHDRLPVATRDPGLLRTLVTQAFSMRRKTLRNALKPLISADQLEAAGVSPSLRPEQISLADYVLITEYLIDSGTYHPEK